MPKFRSRTGENFIPNKKEQWLSRGKNTKTLAPRNFLSISKTTTILITATMQRCFARVINQQVAEAISQVETAVQAKGPCKEYRGMTDVPKEPVVIGSVEFP